MSLGSFPVGVDSRWLERSLEAHYQTLLERPGDYLEKIFQIPFTLRRMTRTEFRDLVDELTPRTDLLAQGGDMTSDDSLVRVAPPPSGGTASASTPFSRRTTDGVTAPDEAEGVTTDIAAVPLPKPANSIAAQPPPLPRPEALVISDDERALLGQLVASFRRHVR